MGNYRLKQIMVLAATFCTTIGDQEGPSATAPSCRVLLAGGLPRGRGRGRKTNINVSKDDHDRSSSRQQSRICDDRRQILAGFRNGAKQMRKARQCHRAHDYPDVVLAGDRPTDDEPSHQQDQINVWDRDERRDDCKCNSNQSNNLFLQSQQPPRRVVIHLRCLRSNVVRFKAQSHRRASEHAPHHVCASTKRDVRCAGERQKADVNSKKGRKTTSSMGDIKIIAIMVRFEFVVGRARRICGNWELTPAEAAALPV